MRVLRPFLLGFALSAVGVAAPVAAFSATYVVDTVSDDPDLNPGDGLCETAYGSCSLRAALQETATSPDSDEILFAIPGAGVKVIRVQSSLPQSGNVQVLGRSQGGVGYSGPPLIEVDGASAGNYDSGFYLANGSLLEGVAVHSFGMHAVVLHDAAMVGSFVGLDASGTISLPNRDSAVVLGQGSRLGPDTPVVNAGPACDATCNVIAGNRRDGVEIIGSNVQINHTRIGLAPDGETVIGNGSAGIRVSLLFAGRVRGVVLGALAPNVIAGHRNAAISIASSGVGSPDRVQVQRTPMYQNQGGAIIFGSDGFPLNDLGDTDVGPNLLLNTPYLSQIDLLESEGAWRLQGASRARHLDVYLSETEDALPASQRGSTVFLGSFDLDSAANTATGTLAYHVPEVGQDDARAFDIEVPYIARGATLIALARDANGNTSILSNPITWLGAELDSDEDGLPDALERAWGLDPFNADSDGDSLPDGLEFGDRLVPRDTDGDGVIDALDSDDDGDGIPTLEEIQAVGTLIDLDGDGRPAWLDTDSDGDGIPDGVEYQRTLGNADIDGDGQPAWNDVDSDGDGLCDSPFVQSIECTGGEDLNADGVLDPGETDPYAADTDNDGICDGPTVVAPCAAAEDNCPLVPNADQADSVGDGVGDACRCDGDVCPNGTTRCYADLDGDGFTGTPVVLPGNLDCSTQSYAGRAMTAASGGDCDDSDPSVHPAAIERCDGIDNNCNGLIDTEDPQVAQLDPGVTGASYQVVYIDADADGCGIAGTERYACDVDDPGVSINDLDQDDSDGVCCGNGVLDPGEVCDGAAIDGALCPGGGSGVPLCRNNPLHPEFDGTCELGSPIAGCVSVKDCYADLDGDGFTGTVRTITTEDSCSNYAEGPANTPWSDVSDGDCNDRPSDPCAAVTYPGAPELCDGCLNTCDPSRQDGDEEPWFGDACTLDETPEGCPRVGLVCDASGSSSTCGVVEYLPETRYFEDLDNDGCGNAAASIALCEGDDPPEGWVDNALDLDDSDGVCCGNDILDDGEECERASSVLCSDIGESSPNFAYCSSTCMWDRSYCSLSGCGDGYVEVSAGESCDPGAVDAPENCRENCTYCGDGILQTESGETCERRDSYCRMENCTYCGDGIVQRDEGEECEPGENRDGVCPYGETDCTFCDTQCTVQPGVSSFCGDGVVDGAAGEECDGEAGCDEDCRWNASPQGESGCGCSGVPAPFGAGIVPCIVLGVLLSLRRRRAHGAQVG